MRIVFASLSIALIIQVCSAGIPARVKRSAYIEDNIKELVSFAKAVVKESGPMVTAAIDALPTTEDYNQYRDHLDAYLRRLADYKAHSGRCVTKSFDIVTTFLVLDASYARQDAAEKTKEVYKLLNDNGLGELKNKAEKWMKTLDSDKFRNGYRNVSAYGKVKSIFMEIC